MAANYSSFRARIVCGVALLGVALLSPLTGFGQRQITIAGQVMTADGTPVTNGAMATLTTRQGIHVATQPVNANGSFQFAQMPAATYVLTVTADDFKGKVVLLYFGYTFCPDVCPTTLYNLSTILKHLGDKAKDIRVQLGHDVLQARNLLQLFVAGYNTANKKQPTKH